MNTIAEINKAFDETCKIVLGGSLGNIENYDSYLHKYTPQIRVKKSEISKQDVAVFEEYSKGARFISGNEAETYKKIIEKEPLNINQIKDVDSLVEGIRENIYYAGNICLGKTENTHLSNRIFDSYCIYKSTDLLDCRFMAHAQYLRHSEYMFGAVMGAENRVAIHAFESYKSSRLFETLRAWFSSDCYYSVNMDGCQECMFCFNLRNKRNCIGNLQLPFDKYNLLKAKLVGELRNNLNAKKNLPTVSEIVGDLA